MALWSPDRSPGVGVREGLLGCVPRSGASVTAVRRGGDQGADDGLAPETGPGGHSYPHSRGTFCSWLLDRHRRLDVAVPDVTSASPVLSPFLPVTLLESEPPAGASQWPGQGVRLCPGRRASTLVFGVHDDRIQTPVTWHVILLRNRVLSRRPARPLHPCAQDVG